MKRIVTIFSALAFSIMLTSSTPDLKISEGFQTVYVCTGNYAKKYHYSKTCRGLNNCKSSVVSKSLSDAQKSGKTLCGWEK